MALLSDLAEGVSDADRPSLSLDFSMPSASPAMTRVSRKNNAEIRRGRRDSIAHVRILGTMHRSRLPRSSLPCSPDTPTPKAGHFDSASCAIDTPPGSKRIA